MYLKLQEARGLARVLDKDHPGPVRHRVVVDPACALEPHEEARNEVRDHDEGNDEDGEADQEINRQLPRAPLPRHADCVNSPVFPLKVKVFPSVGEWRVTW